MILHLSYLESLLGPTAPAVVVAEYMKKIVPPRFWPGTTNFSKHGTNERTDKEVCDEMQEGERAAATISDRQTDLLLNRARFFEVSAENIHTSLVNGS